MSVLSNLPFPLLGPPLKQPSLHVGGARNEDAGIVSQNCYRLADRVN